MWATPQSVVHMVLSTAGSPGLADEGCGLGVKVVLGNCRWVSWMGQVRAYRFPK